LAGGKPNSRPSSLRTQTDLTRRSNRLGSRQTDHGELERREQGRPVGGLKHVLGAYFPYLIEVG
jgi:hypothetical protein